MIIYIAGAISGKFNYRERFMDAERKLKEMGHIVVNPAYLPDGLQYYFDINKAMIDQCEAIYVLGDSDNSVGTDLEIDYCIDKGWSIEAGTIIFEEL